MAVLATIVREAIDASAWQAAVSGPANGAVLLFHGLVRNHHAGHAVERIRYHAYEEMALMELRRVAERVAREHGVSDLAVVHRLGDLAVGEASLLVAVGSPHRAEAFAAGQAVIDCLKQRVPIWKQESGPDGTRWVEGQPVEDN